ncbi:hypothetical protein CR513_19990, partial [Mucuna pruriens]
MKPHSTIKGEENSGMQMVAKLNIVRVLLSLANNLDWPQRQFDVKNAFLRDNLEEEVFMDIPLGYTVSLQAKVVYKLQKNLYGLKQLPRAWFGRFSITMKKFGFKQEPLKSYFISETSK